MLKKKIGKEPESKICIESSICYKYFVLKNKPPDIMVLWTEVRLYSAVDDTIVLHIVERPQHLHAIYSLVSTHCQGLACTALTLLSPDGPGEQG